MTLEQLREIHIKSVAENRTKERVFYTVKPVSKVRHFLNNITKKIITFFRPEKVVTIPPTVAASRSHDFWVSSKASRRSIVIKWN